MFIARPKVNSDAAAVSSNEDLIHFTTLTLLPEGVFQDCVCSYADQEQLKRPQGPLEDQDLILGKSRVRAPDSAFSSTGRLFAMQKSKS